MNRYMNRFLLMAALAHRAEAIDMSNEDGRAPVNDWITLLFHFMQKTGFVPAE